MMADTTNKKSISSSSSRGVNKNRNANVPNTIDHVCNVFIFNNELVNSITCVITNIINVQIVNTIRFGERFEMILTFRLL